MGNSSSSPVVECQAVSDAFEASQDPATERATWPVLFDANQSFKLPIYGSVLLGFRTAEIGTAATITMTIGSSIEYSIDIPEDGQLVPALFGTSALPVGSLTRDDVTMYATARVEALYAFDKNDPYEVDYTKAYKPWKLGDSYLVANGRVWDVNQIQTLPVNYPNA